MDKAPDFGLPFFYRVIVPGAILTAAATPLVIRLLTALGIPSSDLAAILAGLVIFLGFFLSLLDDSIYQIFEGRMWWPQWLSRRRTKRWGKRVETLHGKAKDPKDPMYKEYWYRLRQFPTKWDEKTQTWIPAATEPTKIGNVLASYENYPDDRYRMDSVFYWPRLWWAIDKDTRDQVDTSWAIVDSLMYTSAGAALLALIYALSALVSYVASLTGRVWIFSSDQERLLATGGAASLILLAYLCMRFSVSGHLRNGETFKALFDLNRSKLTAMAVTKVSEKESWDQTFRYLQYGRLPAAKPGLFVRIWQRLKA